MIERPATPHFLRFVRALAFVSGAAGSVSACASTAGTSDASEDSPYDGASHGIGPSVDAGITTMPDVYDGASTGIDAGIIPGADATGVHDGAVIGVVVMVDSGHD